MATINLGIVSTVTYKKSIGAIIGADPQFQVLRDLNGNVYPAQAVQIRTLSVSQPSPYVFNYRTTSTSQTVSIFNVGNSVLTLYGAEFTSNGVVPVLDSNGQLLFNQTRIPLLPGGQYTFGLSYYADNPGVYNNTFTITSDDNISGGIYTVPTSQSITRDYDFYVDSQEMVATVSNLGGTVSKRFSVYTVDPADTLLNFSPTILSNSPGYSVTKVGDNAFDLNFNAALVSNQNGNYTVQVSVYAVVAVQGQPGPTATARNISGSVTVNINVTQYQHYASWISPGSYNNSIIGVSYDRINNQNYLTIGVGAGADGAPEYAAGGAPLLSVSSLGLAYSPGQTAFPYWNQVYRIPISGAAGTYLSGGYAVKTGTVNYGSYFGDFGNRGSMFIVDDDGFNNLRITLNSLRALTGNINLDVTLINLSKAFYYYSVSDAGPGRITQLGSPAGDGTQTELFTGFNSLGQIVTELVSIQ